MLSKKKYLAALIIALIAVLSLAMFTGCGSGSDSGASDQTDAEAAEEAEEPADPAELFTGTWIFAAAESEGVTMAGDFATIFGEDGGVASLTINDDGTGEMKLGDDSSTLKWALKSDKSITIKPDEETDEVGDEVEVFYQDDSLRMEMKEDDQSATVIFTKDGKYAGAKIIDMSEAVPITSADELIGTWSMTGLKMMGVSCYGSKEALKNLSGGEETTITFNKDGTIDMSGESGTWKVDSNGATVSGSDSTGSYTAPIMKLGDDITFDLTEHYSDMEFVLLFSK